MRAKPRGFVEPSHAEGRRELRIPVSLEGALGSSRFAKRRALLLDISGSGCCVEAVADVDTGTRMVLTVQQLRPLGCEVRWAAGGRLGLRFDTPLHRTVVTRIVARAVREVA